MEEDARQKRTVSGSGSASFTASYARAGEQLRDVVPLPAPELRAVRPLTGLTLAIGDATLEFTSLELYSSLAVVRYSYRWHARLRTRLLRLEWSATDDAGTVYAVGTTLSGVNAVPGRLFEDRTLEPAPPPEATFLRLVASGGGLEAAVEIPLKGLL